MAHGSRLMASRAGRGGESLMGEFAPPKTSRDLAGSVGVRCCVQGPWTNSMFRAPPGSGELVERTLGHALIEMVNELID